MPSTNSKFKKALYPNFKKMINHGIDFEQFQSSTVKENAYHQNYESQEENVYPRLTPGIHEFDAHL